MLRIVSVALLSLLTATGCSSPAVWRSAAFGPEAPAPTLMVASGFNYSEVTQTIDLTGIPLTELDWGAVAEGLVDYAVENPDVMLDMYNSAKSASERRQLAMAAIATLAPEMYAEVVTVLEAQGFRIATDGGVAAGLDKFKSDQKMLWSAPGTAANPFGGAVDRDGLEQPGTISSWGGESKKNLRDALTAGGAGGPFASVQAQFVPKGNDPRKGFTCYLVVFVLDAEAELAFSGKTEGQGGDIRSAFDAALAPLREPAIEPVE